MDPAAARKMIWDWFGESEVYIGTEGATFLSDKPYDRMFSKFFFDDFYYDDASKSIALRPSGDLYRHNHLEDCMQHLPGKKECETLWEHDMLTIYHMQKEVSEATGELQLLQMESFGDVDRKTWIKAHPGCLNMLMD